MNELQEKRQELREWASKKFFAIILAFPIFWIGFSQMYHPKYTPQQWFIWVCAIAFLISMSYFFEPQTRFVMEKIRQLRGVKNTKNND